MAEPLSTTAAAVAAAPAATAAAPAASSAAPAVAGAAPSAASGSGVNSPVYGMKAHGSPLDSVATQPSTVLDASSMQRTLGCHDGSGALPKNTSAHTQTPGEMPNVTDHWFNGKAQHGPAQIPQLEQPGSELRAPDIAPHERVGTSSPEQRAQVSNRTPGASDPLEPRPEQRATTDPTIQADQSHASSSHERPPPSQPEPAAPDFAQSPHPGFPPKAAPSFTGPTPTDAATEPEPNRMKRTAETAPPNLPEELPPLLSPEVEATTLGIFASFFGMFVEGLADWGDLVFDTFSMHGDKPGAREDWENAREEFRTFSEVTGGVALDKHEFFGSLGMALGGIGPEAISPGNKVNVVGAGATAAAATGGYVKKQIKKKLGKKTKKRKG